MSMIESAILAEGSMLNGKQLSAKAQKLLPLIAAVRDLRTEFNKILNEGKELDPFISLDTMNEQARDLCAKEILEAYANAWVRARQESLSWPSNNTKT